MAESTIHDRITWDRKVALPEARNVVYFRDYARGRHRSTLTQFQMYIMRGLLSHRFCDNVCKKVLAELRNRLKLSRFDTTDTQVLEFLHEFWVKNKLLSLASSIHWAAMRDGNTAIGLQWTDRVILTRERWWNGRYGFFISYDDNDEPVYAVRDWKAQGGIFRTVWFPDHIERYQQSGNGWQKRVVEGDPPTGWPQWKDKAGKPLGIPFVHFANLQVPNDGTGDDSPSEPDSHYGLSELDGGMLGLQDEINDVHRDMTASGRFVGFPMMFGTGITPSKTPDGSSSVQRFKPEPGAFFTDTSKDARFGMIGPGSIKELEALLTVKLQAVSRQSGIPMHIITGDWPSGEALLRSETPMIDKVESIGAAFGPAWSSVAFKAIRIQNAFGTISLDENSLVVAIFENAAKRDPLTQALVAEKKGPFVSIKEALRLFGYSDQQADKIIKEKLEEIANGVPQIGIGRTTATTDLITSTAHPNTAPSGSAADANQPTVLPVVRPTEAGAGQTSSK